MRLRIDIPSAREALSSLFYRYTIKARYYSIGAAFLNMTDVKIYLRENPYRPKTGVGCPIIVRHSS